MNRYLLGLLVGVMGLLTVYGMSNSQGALRQVTRTSRNMVSANPSAAADAPPGLPGAGFNVIRQTAADGLENAQTFPRAQGQTVPAEGQTTSPTGTPAQPAPAPTTVTPAPAVVPATRPADQDAIPALW